MVALAELSTFIDGYLSCDTFADYVPNGVQVEGRTQVRRLITGVTASHSMIERAIADNADAVLVHHGYFWKGEDARIVGMKKRRLQLLLRNDVSLLAYHLPLDAHPTVGNNAQFGRALGFAGAAVDRQGMLWYATLDSPVSFDQIAQLLARTLHRAPLHVGPERGDIRRIMWCTGAAQKYLSDAARHGADAFISGEISEQTTHEARELGVHYFAAGHYATEQYGVRALGDVVARQFGVEHVFVDETNPA